jgi:DsbC/DsbD-like thiol-disulfide interchange protein
MSLAPPPGEEIIMYGSGDTRSRPAGSTANLGAPPGASFAARLRLVTLAASLGVAVVGAAATPASGPQVQARLIAPPSAVAGGKVRVVVEMTLGPGWHVNSHRPAQSFLIPTTAALTASNGTFTEVRYPEPVTKKFEFADEALAVYEGTVRFEAELALPATAAGKVDLGGALSYQPCNETQCYPPAKATLGAAVAVAPRERR